MSTGIPDDRGEEFLQRFRSIEDHMRRVLRLGPSVRFSDLIKGMRVLGRITEEQGHQLEKFAFLRNALSHWSPDGGAAIADPRLSAVAAIRDLERSITSPRLVIDVLPQEVATLQATDPISKFFVMIKAKDFSQAPVMDEGRCIGIITLGIVARWIAQARDGAMFDLSRDSVSDVRAGRDQAEDSFNEFASDLTVPQALAQFDATDRAPARGLLLIDRGTTDDVRAIVTYEDIPTLLRNS